MLSNQQETKTCKFNAPSEHPVIENTMYSTCSLYICLLLYSSPPELSLCFLWGLLYLTLLSTMVFSIYNVFIALYYVFVYVGPCESEFFSIILNLDNIKRALVIQASHQTIFDSGFQ